MNDRKIIPLSKKKALVALIGSALFVFGGYLGAKNPENLVSPLFRSPEIIRIAGIVSVVFFGLCLVFITRKFFDRKPGLIIDENGITDNSSATSVGLIEWGDIISIEKKQVMSTKFLIVHTKHPNKYIQRANNYISRRALEVNNKTYGSPITITSNSLIINFEDLETLLTQEIKKNKKYL